MPGERGGEVVSPVPLQGKNVKKHEERSLGLHSPMAREAGTAGQPDVGCEIASSWTAGEVILWHDPSGDQMKLLGLMSHGLWWKRTRGRVRLPWGSLQRTTSLLLTSWSGAGLAMQLALPGAQVQEAGRGRR